MQSLAYRSCNAGNKLHVQATAGHVVVFEKRIHLRFIGVTAEKRTAHNSINILHKRIAPYVRMVLFRYAPYDISIRKTYKMIAA